MNITPRSLTGACALFASLCISANAEVLAQFNFDGDSAASSDASIFSSAMTNWDLTNSAAQNTITGGVSTVTANHNPVNAPGGIPGISATTVDPADGGSQWQQFSFTVANLGVGETLNLTSFDYQYEVKVPLNFESAVYSSLSGYSGTSDSLGGTANTSAAQVFTPSLDLTGNIAFSGLTNGTIVEFRIYLKDSSTNINDRLHELDNIAVNGTVIPEPGSYALIAGILGLTSVMLRRRR